MARHLLKAHGVRNALLGLLLLVAWSAPAWGRSTRPRAASTRTPVPTLSQQTRYSCGTAAFGAVLRRRGRFVSEKVLREQLRTGRIFGTHPDDIVAVAPLYGLKARARQRTRLADLAQALDAGHDVLIDLQAWTGKKRMTRAEWRRSWDSGHWVVLKSIAADGTLRFMDPWVASEQKSGRARDLPRGELILGQADFLARWHDTFVDKTPQRRYVTPRKRRAYRQLAIILEAE